MFDLLRVDIFELKQKAKLTVTKIKNLNEQYKIGTLAEMEYIENITELKNELSSIYSHIGSIIYAWDLDVIQTKKIK